MSAPVLSPAEQAAMEATKTAAMEALGFYVGTEPESYPFRSGFERGWLACREWAEEQAASLGEDEWHTDGDGRVLGGAPPDFVFVAWLAYAAALGRERVLREALEFYAAGIGFSEREDNGATAREALAALASPTPQETRGE